MAFVLDGSVFVSPEKITFLLLLATHTCRQSGAMQRRVLKVGFCRGGADAALDAAPRGEEERAQVLDFATCGTHK